MRIFKTRWFVRFARQYGIEDAALCQAIENAEKGMSDADLGGGVIKQRIARPHAGKSGGFRTIILFRSGDKAFFVYGFLKSKLDNIRNNELKGFKELSTEMLNYDKTAIAKALNIGAITEVKCR